MGRSGEGRKGIQEAVGSIPTSSIRNLKGGGSGSRRPLFRLGSGFELLDVVGICSRMGAISGVMRVRRYE